VNFRPTIAAALALGLWACGNASGPTAQQQVKIISLDDQATALREAFNQDRGNVRLLFMVDPVCPGCLRGIADIDRDLLSQLPADAKVKVYVVHEPVIGGTERDIPKALGLMHTSAATHFWNASGAFGKQVSQALSLRKGDELVYAWDVWMAYPPDAEWSGVSIPKPQLFMHQLQGLMDNPTFPSLDSKAFAADVRGLLKQVGALR
jgi:hypothetical protein